MQAWISDHNGQFCCRGQCGTCHAIARFQTASSLGGRKKNGNHLTAVLWQMRLRHHYGLILYLVSKALLRSTVNWIHSTDDLELLILKPRSLSLNNGCPWSTMERVPGIVAPELGTLPTVAMPSAMYRPRPQPY